MGEPVLAQLVLQLKRVCWNTAGRLLTPVSRAGRDRLLRKDIENLTIKEIIFHIGAMALVSYKLLRMKYDLA